MECHTTVDLLNSYLADTILRPATIKSFKGVVHVFDRQMGTPNLSDIDRTMIIAFRDHILARAAATTFNSYLTHLRTLFNFGVKTGLISRNPFLEVKRAPIYKRRKIVSDAVLANAIAFLQNQNYCDESDQRLKPAWFWITVIRTLYNTGIRRRQLVTIRWKDVDWENLSVLLTAEGSKTRREWTIPLTPTLIGELSTLRARQQQLLGNDIGDRQVFNVTLFSNRYRGTTMTEFQVSGFFRRLSEHLGSRISSHRLRHTTATHLV
ncbi:MAG: tyrosine-type recombinase/integrase, partial [Gammaproteobacteria bacterium]|nr:tyrosine-type recombinase/integrase [Gammaproteobacteria bacterium]